MHKFILGTFFLLSSALCAAAQLNNAEALSEARQTRLEMLIQQRAERAAQEQIGKRDVRTAASAAAIGDSDVGEASSFNKNAKFFGTATAGFVVLDPVCDPVALDLGPDDRCLNVSNPAVTASATFNDIGRISLPGKQADNVIYLIANHSTSFVFQNTDASPVSGLLTYSPSITIESDALNDPAAIDPNTGLPMNGSYTTTGLGTKSSNRTLAPFSIDVQTESYSRANTNGLSRTFWASLGLPNSVINQLYKKPMTIRLNVRVSARRVESGVFIFSTRLLAN